MVNTRVKSGRINHGAFVMVDLCQVILLDKKQMKQLNDSLQKLKHLSCFINLMRLSLVIYYHDYQVIISIASGSVNPCKPPLYNYVTSVFINYKRQIRDSWSQNCNNSNFIISVLLKFMKKHLLIYTLLNIIVIK